LHIQPPRLFLPQLAEGLPIRIRPPHDQGSMCIHLLLELVRFRFRDENEYTK